MSRTSRARVGRHAIAQSTSLSLALSLSALLLAAAAPPPELAALSSMVADVHRPGAERRAALQRSVALRRELLSHASGTERNALALDQAEALTLVGPSLEATDAFALAGLLTSSDAAALSAAIDEAGALLASTSNLAPSDATRRAIIETIIAARRIDLAAARGDPADATSSLDESIVARLATPARETARLALARIALKPRPADADRLRATVADASDAPPLLRNAARALGAIGAAERGDAGSIASLVRLGEQAGASDTASRLLFADALARAARSLGSPPNEAIAAWSTLLATTNKIDAVALRATIVQRVRATVPPPPIAETSSLPALTLAAYAPDLSKADAAATAAALGAATARVATTDPLSNLLRYELARARGLAGDLADAADEFFELAASASDDPLAADAMDLAIEISTDIALKAAATEADRERATRIARTGVEQFYDHPHRGRWLACGGELALAGGRLGEAQASFARIANDPGARLGEALAATASAAAVANAGERAKDVEAASALLERAGASESGRRDLVEGWIMALRGDRAAALERLTRALGDRRLAAHDVEWAIAVFLRTEAAAGATVALDANAISAANRAPAAARRAIVEYVRETMLALDHEPVERVRSAAAQALGGLVPLPPAVMQIASDEERALVARAMIRAGKSDDAYRVTATLLSESPKDEERMLLHATAAESVRRAEALAIYRAVIAATHEGSSAWWRAQLGELLLMESEPAPTTDAARDAADLVLARINRLRQRDEQLGGDATRAQFEALAERVRARSSLGH